MRLFIGRIVSLGFILLSDILLAPAVGGEILEAIKARGELRCGVSEGVPGFSAQDASGRWTGLDVDFCRAVAAAVLSDPEKIVFVPLKSSERFPALLSRRIDLLAHQTTWTFEREVLLGVVFPAVLFYDGQAFMVPGNTQVKTVADLNGLDISVEKGTTEEQHLVERFSERGLSVKPMVIDSAAGAADALFSGRCQAYTSVASQLAAMRLTAPEGPDQYVILPDRISKEPLSPAVVRGDEQWATIVRWVLFAQILAEESGITQDNVDAKASQSPNAAWRIVAGREPLIVKAMGVEGDWAVRAVKAAGNYGEMYERNVGTGSLLKIDRGLNRLWKDGGLMYSPPIN